MGKIKKLITLTGACVLFKPLYVYGTHYYNTQFKEQSDGIPNAKRVKTNYNPKGQQWAVVTGGSEGIGYAFADELAKNSFNVLIAARSLDKMEKARAELLKSHEHAKVKVASVDLTSVAGISSVLADKEVAANLGVVVNNAAQFVTGPFLSQDPAALHRQHICNIYAMSLLSIHAKRAFVEQGTGHRFGLIQIVSKGADFPHPHVLHQCSTKRFNDVFSRSLRYTCRKSDDANTTDTLVVKPGLVTTKMANFKSGGFFTDVPENVAGDCLKELGVVRETYGSLLHNLLQLKLAYYPRLYWEHHNAEIGKDSDFVKKWLG